MADSNMSIPVRTQNAGDVVAQLVDATNTLNKLKILADGSINVNVISGGGGGGASYVYDYIAPGQTVTVPIYTQMIVVEELVIAGELVVNGTLILES